MTVSKSNLSAFVPGVTGEQRAIAFADALMRDGELYSVCLIAASVVEAGTASLSLTVGTQANLYATMAMDMVGAGALYVYEDASTTEGTILAPYNMNRASTKTPYVTLVHTPAITTAGTAFYSTLAPAGAVSVAAVLTAGEYVLQAVNHSGTTADIGVRATFYEMEV